MSIIFIILSDDGPILLWTGPVRRLVLLWRVQPNRHWSVVCDRSATDHHQEREITKGEKACYLNTKLW